MPLRTILLAVFMTAICAGSPARATLLKTYVSSSGNDTNNCDLSSPCQSIATALTKAAADGTVSCLSAPVDSSIIITQSVSIDCTGVAFSSATGVSINLPQNDPGQTVRLRGFTLNAVGVTSVPVTILAAGTVILQDMNILQALRQGVLDIRTSPGKLIVTNTAISRNAGPGIVVAGAAGNAAILENVTSVGNQFGIAVAAGNNVTVSRSTLSGNSVAGVEGDGGSQIIVNNSTISHNGIGVQSVSSVRISNNDIAFNATAISGSTGTFGNNRFSGNTSAGTPPTPLGGASSDFAQQ